MAWTRTYDEAEPQRVNRWLAQNGVCSRREAEALIARGLISIDGQPVTEAGHKIEAGQTLTVSIGSELPYARIHEYGGFAGRRGPYKKKDGHRSYIRPRPYLRPAINDLQKALPGLLEQAIQQVQVSQ